MIIKLILCISISLYGSFAFGTECKESVQVIKEGDKAQCTGLLYSEEADKKAAKDYEDAKYYKELSNRLEERKTLTDKEISILDKRLQLYITQSEDLTKSLYQVEARSDWEKAMWFGFGVIATGLAVYGASQLSR